MSEYSCPFLTLPPNPGSECQHPIPKAFSMRFSFFIILSFFLIQNGFKKPYYRQVNALKTFVEFDDICSLDLALIPHGTISPEKVWGEN